MRLALTLALGRHTNAAIKGAVSSLAIAIAFQPAYAMVEQVPPRPPRLALNIAQTVPEGFEDIDESIETVFDIYFSGRRVGTSRVRIANGKATFLDPQGFVQLLPDRIDRDRVLALISTEIASNEGLRCLPGRTSDCGILPRGETGVVVNTERFSLELFLTADYYREPTEGELYLSDPISGPSFIQTANVALSAGNNSGSGVTFGATLDTLASVGRTSFVGQTLVRDDGANLQRAFVQHFWRKRSAAAGLLQESSALTFNSYRVVGAEYGTFFGARRDASEGMQTPLELVLPRAAQVEVYRDNVLIHATNLEAGAQQINTGNFPTGSYPVRIIARDGQTILLDETRVFTKTTDLPPLGEWAYRFKAGMRVGDVDNIADDPLTIGRPFFPHVTNDSLFSASVTRQVVPGIGLSAEVLAIRDKFYFEGSAIGYLGPVRGIAAASVGTDGSHSIILNTSAQIGNFNLNLVGRHTRLSGDVLAPSLAYYRAEDSASAGVSFGLGGGNVSLTGSYTKTENFDDRYTLSARYTRSMDVGSFGLARISAFGLKSNFDTRVGISITFLKRLNRKTVLTYSAGGEYRSRTDGPADIEGAYALADVRLSRQDRIGTVDLSNQVGVSTDSERSRAFASTTATSNYGTLDVTADYENRRGPADGEFGVTANLFTGLVAGGGEVHLGLRQPGGDSALMVKVENPKGRTDPSGGSKGQYRVLVGNQYVGAVEPGGTSTVILPSFREYRVGIQPEGAPPFSVDMSQRLAPLYPGNVAVIKYQATRVVTIFGRLLDSLGKPVAAARVSGLTDTVMTDELGYFVFAAESDEVVDFYGAQDKICSKLPIEDLIKAQTDKSSADFIKVGDIKCD